MLRVIASFSFFETGWLTRRVQLAGREKVPRTLNVSPVVLFTPRASAFAVAEDLPWVYTPGSNAAVIAIHKAVIAFMAGLSKNERSFLLGPRPRCPAEQTRSVSSVLKRFPGDRPQRWSFLRHPFQGRKEGGQ